MAGGAWKSEGIYSRGYLGIFAFTLGGPEAAPAASGNTGAPRRDTASFSLPPSPPHRVQTPQPGPEPTLVPLHPPPEGPGAACPAACPAAASPPPPGSPHRPRRRYLEKSTVPPASGSCLRSHSARRAMAAVVVAAAAQR